LGLQKGQQKSVHKTIEEKIAFRQRCPPFCSRHFVFTATLEAVTSSETSISYYQSTLLRIQEYFNFHEEGCANLQSRNVDTI
jgi:hypothetical protein